MKAKDIIGKTIASVQQERRSDEFGLVSITFTDGTELRLIGRESEDLPYVVGIVDRATDPTDAAP